MSARPAPDQTRIVRFSPETVPAALTAMAGWVVTGDDKIPHSPATLRRADPARPETGAPFACAVAAVARSAGFDRAGLILDPATRLVALDFDGCRDPETGAIDPAVLAEVDRLGTYAEVSPSGTGLRVLAWGELPPGGRKRGKRECYDRARYVSVTGHALPGRGRINERTAELAAWHAETFPAPPPPPAPVAAAPLDLADEQILERVRRMPRGRRLHDDGDGAGYASGSEADLALANCYVAAGATGEDQIDRLYRSSAIARSKWDRDDYRRRTIAKALDGTVRPMPSPAGPTTPHHADVAAGDEPPADPADPCAGVRDELAALRSAVAQLRAENADLRETVAVQRGRLDLADEQLAIYRNPGLGAQRASAAALARVFRVQAPVPEDRLPAQLKDRRARYRVPLPRLADQTNLSDDAVSRQTKALAGYTTPDGAPVLLREVVDVPGYVDQETGEIVAPHKELWLGPGPDLDPAAWGGVLAKLDPAERRPWGGKADRNACPDHPDAGVIKRTQLVKRTRFACAACHRPVGDAIPDEVVKEKTEPVNPTPHDAASTPPPVVNTNLPRIMRGGDLAPTAAARSAAARADIVVRQRGSSPPSSPPPVAVPLIGLAAPPLDHRTDVAYGARR